VRTFEIEISPRIHLGLISMHAGAPRKNGGLGFEIDSPKASVRAEPAKDFELLDQRPKPMPDEEVAALRGRLSEVQSQLKLPQAARIVIRGDFLTHYGMGSGTAIRLACIEGLLAINRQIPSREELVKLSGRGGTSGVGIATYFDGGFLFDLGVPSEVIGGE
jgi:beta-ribofuranosylaminobenzene 5'-phosphate synthase